MNYTVETDKVKSRIHQLSYFIRHKDIFDDKNILFSFYKSLSADEQYLVFGLLDEKQKLMLISKAGVLSPKIFEHCCRETDAYNACVCAHQMEDRYKLIKDWRKDYKKKDDFGKKIASLFAVLDLMENKNGEVDGQDKIKILKNILTREKVKSYSKKFLFSFLFLFCATNLILVGFIPSVIASVLLRKMLEMFFCASAAFLGIVKYSQLRESYLREDKLIDMLSWISGFLGERKEMNISEDARNLIEVSKELAKNYDVPLPKIVPAKTNSDRENKSKWKTVDKAFKVLMLVLAVGALVSAFTFLFPLSFTFAINFFALKIAGLVFVSGCVLAGVAKTISHFKLKLLRRKLIQDSEKVKQEKFSLDSIKKVDEGLRKGWEGKKIKRNVSVEQENVLDIHKVPSTENSTEHKDQNLSDQI